MKKSRLYPKKVLLCIVHFKVLKLGQTNNADHYCEKLDRKYQSLLEKYPAVVNRKSVILQNDNAKQTIKKLINWSYPRVYIYFDRYIFLLAKKLKICTMSKMPSRDILLKNHRHCTLDGKNLRKRHYLPAPYYNFFSFFYCGDSVMAFFNFFVSRFFR